MFNSLNKFACSTYNIKLHRPFAAIQSNPIHPSFSNIRPNPIQPNPIQSNPWMHPIRVQLWVHVTINMTGVTGCVACVESVKVVKLPVIYVGGKLPVTYR